MNRHRHVRTLKILILLLLFMAFGSSRVLSQISISGPICVIAGHQYSYTLSNYTSSFSYVISNGTLSTGGSSGSHGVGVVTLLITWSSNGTISMYSGSGNRTYYVSTLSNTLTPGIFSSGQFQSLNYNAIPASMTCNAATGGSCTSPNYQYQWQQSTDNVSFSNISGATTLSLPFGAGLTQTTYYRLFITETTSGNTASSSTGTLYVYPQLMPGGLSPSTQSINYNTNASTLTLSGVSGGVNSYTYQWQSSPDNSNWADITGATSTTYTPSGLTAPNNYYRVVVTSNGVNANSGSALVTVYPQLVPGNASASQNINYNTAPSPLSVTGVSGGSGTYTYQWESSPDNNSWAIINGAINPSYSPGNLTATTYYHVTVVSNGVSLNSGVATITVYPQLLVGNLSSPSQVLNYGTLPATLTSTSINGGNGSYSYQWQSSPDNSAWSDISGETASAYAPTGTVGTAYYRLVVTSNGVPVNSNSASVLVYPPIQAGSVSPARQIINYNTAPATLNLSGVSGGNGQYSYQWQSSPDSANWNDINSATSTTYIPSQLKTSTYYRVAVTSNGTVVYSNGSPINVNPQLTPGTINPSYVTITSGTSPGGLTTTLAKGGGCGGSYSYQWQSSTDGINFTNISGITSQNYLPGNLTANIWYRRMVSCSGDNEYSNTIQVMISSITPDLNFIRVRDILKPGVLDSTTSLSLVSPYDVSQTTQYFDGLGRKIQTVAMQQSPQQKDMVTFNVYDAFGREAYTYLPYPASTNDGNYKITAIADQYNFNTSEFPGEQYYYGQTNFEPSPLNRIVSTMAPGLSWQGSGKGTGAQYQINTAADSVRIWTIASTAGSIPTTSDVFPAGTLYKNVISDEAGHQVVEYKDLGGRLILKKVQLSPTPGTAHVGWLSTYYVYDIFSQLRFVIPPQAVVLINGNWDIVTTVADELCFRYEYDQRHRMIIKKIPGADEAWMVYDYLNRLVMTQDANLRASGKWMVTTYDDQNRPVITGLLMDANNRSYHQNLAYNSSSYPSTSSNFELLTQTYYDNYDWAAAQGLANGLITTHTSNGAYFNTSYNSSPVYAQPVTQYPITRGMVTGTATKVIGTANQFLSSVSFYDDRGRQIQTQSINQTGGKDTTTNQYDFTGKPIRTLIAQQKAGNNAQSHTVLTKMNCDAGGRLLTIYKNIDNAIADQLIATNSYNELGRLRSKYLGNNLDSLVYAYNIRGWLTGINKNFIAGAAGNYFGMELAYDKPQAADNITSYTNLQYNGNIAGTIWKTAGDGVGRKYDFTYDNVNRLTGADFNQAAGTGYDKTAGLDFSASNLTYDDNGNILSMKQMGYKVGGSSAVDQLKYRYQLNSNKLLEVYDTVSDATTKLGDFHDGSNVQGTDDYSYDGNGNLTLDNNKGISGIIYNYLNLPRQVSVTSKGTITYTYDAAGTKLYKTTIDSMASPSKTTVTTYQGPFVYQNDTLQFVAHEEGRARWAWHKYTNGDSAHSFEYDFFEKDHLGNTRVVISQQKDTARYLASMEAAYRSTERQLFSNIENTSYAVNQIPGTYPTDNTTTPNDSVARVNGSGQKLGPYIVLKVMAGDTISIAVKSYYISQGGTTTSPSFTDVLASLATGVVNLTSGGKGTLAELNNTSGPLDGALTSFISEHNASQPAGKPKAYLNWIALDEQLKYVGGDQSGAVPVGNFPSETLGTPGQTGMVVSKNGYMYIYVNNESESWDVFFDNLSIEHKTGHLLEETHYYPFGLTMAGISSKALKPYYAENKYRYNKGSELQNKEFSDGSGLEMYDTHFRNLDPQLGRWWQIDPKPTYDQSPYSAMQDNPIRYDDFLGDTSHITITNQRTTETSESTLGTLTVTNDEDKSQLNGYVLEPPKGTNEEAQTEGSDKAILPGTYKVIPHNSAKFKHTFELKNKKLLGTKIAILIHAGNKPKDTHGCQLVGCGAGKDQVTESRAMLKKINNYVNNASKNDIKNGGDGGVSIQYITIDPPLKLGEEDPSNFN